MNDLPPPLTPADCDLQDFPFMPLHVARLRDSDLAAEAHPEACWYAVLLWSASWHQLPAGSLPDNDAVLMRLIGLGRDVKTFKKHRADALRGWALCSDGRLYHPVVAEQVVAGWESKLRQRHRTLCAAIRKHNERKPDDKRDSPDYEAWTSLECPGDMASYVTAMSRVTAPEVTRETPSKRQGQGERQGDSIDDADASSPRKRSRRIDPDWQPTKPYPDGVEALVSLWPPGREAREVDGFRDYWLSRSKDAAKLDWDMTWHNRIRDQHDRILRENRNARSNGQSRSGHGSTVDAALDFIADGEPQGSHPRFAH